MGSQYLPSFHIRVTRITVENGCMIDDSKLSLFFISALTR
jgi:glycine cleavage system regulatory protein